MEDATDEFLKKNEVELWMFILSEGGSDDGTFITLWWEQVNYANVGAVHGWCGRTAAIEEIKCAPEMKTYSMAGKQGYCTLMAQGPLCKIPKTRGPQAKYSSPILDI